MTGQPLMMKGATMEVSFSPVEWAEIQPEVSRHLATLPTAIESYVEEHILAARHYRALVDGQAAGFAAIHNEQLITLFALDDAFKRAGQAAYRALRALESVQASLVPTCDEFWLTNALDEHRQLTKQAYLFSTPADLTPPPAPPGLSWRVVGREYVELVRRETADFFAPIERRIADEQLFIAYAGEQCAGFGILEPSALYPDVASIGMFTLESARRQGVGTATIGFLIGECRRRGLRPIAGCWYYNHRSRQTLQRAGMFARSRLLRIEH
jgi:GNAT superfamily N-acetyltransferase